MDFGAKRQIALVIGAQRVAMHDQDFTAIEVQSLFFGEQDHPALAGKALANEKIAVAMDEVARHAGVDDGFDCRGNLLVQRVRSSSPIHASNRSPGYTERLHGGLRPVKTQKTGGDRRFFCLQVQICNKSVATNYSLTVTLLMITSSFGTSRCMPLRPVATALILSTTSMPSTTSAKTQ